MRKGSGKVVSGDRELLYHTSAERVPLMGGVVV